MSDNARQMRKIRSKIAYNLIKLIPNVKLLTDDYFSVSESTIIDCRAGRANPSKGTMRLLLPRIKLVYQENYYDADKENLAEMRSLLNNFNQDLMALGVFAQSNEPKYIEPDENICKQLIPYCLNLIEYDRLSVPYWLTYRPDDQKKLSFPPYLSPSKMKGQIIIGREKECEEIHQLLNTCKDPIYLYSMAGLGKTTIVQKYVRVYSDRLDLMISVPSSSKNVCYDVLNELAPEQLNYSNDNSTGKNIIKALYKFAEGMKNYEKQVLLIIDNLDSDDQLFSIDHLKPLRDIGWKILITTRITNEAIASKTIYEIKHLSEENCIRLFNYYYFDNEAKQELFPNQEKKLRKLLKILKYHTYLTQLVAQVGKSSGADISELLDTIVEKKTNTLKLDGILDAKVYDKREHKNRKIRNIILTLINMSKLDKNEKRILGYFTLMPDTPSSQQLLIQWMSDEKELLPIPLCTVLTGLCEKSLLLKGNSGDREYKCHSLVQNALTMDKETKDSFDYLPFIKNVTQYLNFPYDGVERTDIFKNLPNLSVILAKYNEETKERYQLIKQYLSCCIYFGCCNTECLEYKEEMLNLFNKFYSTESENYQLEKIICQYINNETYFQASNEIGKASKVRKMRMITAEAAKSYYEEKPLLCIRINQMYASSLNRDGEFEEALKLLNEQEKNIQFALQQKDLSNTDEWNYALFRNYELLGIVSNAQWLDDKSKSLEEILTIRKKYLKIGKTFLTKDSYKLRSCYNDLGMTYLYMYDEKKDDSLLNEAEHYLQLSYQIAVERYGENSSQCITATKNVASLFIRRYDFAKAKMYATIAYMLRKSKTNSDSTRGLMIDARFLGLIHLKEFQHQTTKERSLLEKALEYSKEALEISERLHAGEDNRDSRRNRARIQEIEQEIDYFDNSQE
ncbi:hypothetical protein I588_00506 [Enterococcus pallens ATCC BAA-351]|uniref:NB-ARC domain-containing protein n=2 Tax=Enterococcus pallens TaxID=160454 RepID=R2T067_9ENTE|nr:hypothetical protein UAU_02375 [Enterococcus pallens ATCC BAA-351]EOU24519.1 hypothetical protein I588_00506 [Enterococcus pallens ATCC BAA-351]